VHTPVQAPVTQAWLEHATAPPQAPVAPQVCTDELPEHWVSPGAQVTHPPFRHTGDEPVHATAIPHCPVASHVSTPPAAQRVDPGVQTPLHAPPMHT
jgi:rubredoxin